MVLLCLLQWRCTDLPQLRSSPVTVTVLLIVWCFKSLSLRLHILNILSQFLMCTHEQLFPLYPQVGQVCAQIHTMPMVHNLKAATWRYVFWSRTYTPLADIVLKGFHFYQMASPSESGAELFVFGSMVSVDFVCSFIHWRFSTLITHWLYAVNSYHHFIFHIKCWFILDSWGGL